MGRRRTRFLYTVQDFSYDNKPEKSSFVQNYGHQFQLVSLWNSDLNTRVSPCLHYMMTEVKVLTISYSSER